MKKIVAVMGPGKDATEEDIQIAEEIGELIARQGWVTLTGGVNAGVMHAACVGAKRADGETIGILPHVDSDVSDKLDIAIRTDIGSARNTINVLSSDVLLAVGISPGTSSELSFALQGWANKHVVLLNCGNLSYEYFSSLRKDLVYAVGNTEEAISKIKDLI